MRLFVFRLRIHLPTKTVGFRQYSRYAADTVDIFSDTKQGGYLYRCTDQYNIYRSVQYEIDFLNWGTTRDVEDGHNEGVGLFLVLF